jgi:beta-lactamase class A
VSDVVAAIQNEIDAFDGTVGVAAKNLGTGEEIGVNADEETGTASTVKVPILIEVFRQVEAGDVDLETKIADGPETRTPGSGILRDLSVGNPLSVRDVAILMIIVSDNTATNMLIDLVGMDRINATMQECGFTRTQLRNRIDFPKIGDDVKGLAVTTPRELAAIMEALATGRILNDESRAEIKRIMQMQHYLDNVPRYLPYTPYAKELGKPDNGLRIANKTGGWSGFRADMALVDWPGTRYVIGVVSDKHPDVRFWSENEGSRVIGRISKLIFDHWGGHTLAPIS